MRRQAALLLALALLLSACALPGERPPVETRVFTDSCGREAEVPTEIETVVPSGALAQIVLYTLCPDKLQSLAAPLTRTQKKYLDAHLADLPVTGQFYGGGATIGYEAIAAAAPDIIIDVGTATENIAADMDELQRRTGVPTVFIEAELDTLAEAYETLGELVGEAAQAAACASYIRDTLAEADALAGQLAEKKRVLYAQGEYGTEVTGRGNIHSEVLDRVGAVNVADLDGVVAGKGTQEVSMEQILLWDPEIVLLAPDANYDEIFDDPLWANVSAVQTGQVYEIPMGPYNWLDRPPSVQRILGVKWLGNLLYPELFDFDMAAEAQRFYSLFYHYELSVDDARALMAHSTYREE